MDAKKEKIRIFVGGSYNSHHGLIFHVTAVNRDGVYWTNHHGDIGRTPSFHGFRVRLSSSNEDSPREKAEKTKRGDLEKV